MPGDLQYRPHVAALPVPGVYEHYKGGVYRLLLVALDEATKEPVAVYVSVSGGGGECWVRPVRSWTEDVGGRPRFRVRPDLA